MYRAASVPSAALSYKLHCQVINYKYHNYKFHYNSLDIITVSNTIYVVGNIKNTSLFNAVNFVYLFFVSPLWQNCSMSFDHIGHYSSHLSESIHKEVYQHFHNFLQVFVIIHDVLHNVTLHTL